MPPKSAEFGTLYKTRIEHGGAPRCVPSGERMAVEVHPSPPAHGAADMIREWRAIPVAVIVDLEPGAQIDPSIRPIDNSVSRSALCGRALTAKCFPPDYGAVIYALDLVQPGDVLVVEASGWSDSAMLGDIISGHLRRRGCVGVVCDGAVRDVATIARWSDFSVYARSINPRGPSNAVAGAVNAPVTIGGRTVNPGDLVVGDPDGLASLAPAQAAGLIETARSRLVREERSIEALEAGQPAAVAFGFVDPSAGSKPR